MKKKFQILLIDVEFLFIQVLLVYLLYMLWLTVCHDLVHSDPLRHMPEIDAFKEGITGLTFNRNDPNDLAIKLYSMMSNTGQLDFNVERMFEYCRK